MKKAIAAALTLVLALTLLSACGAAAPSSSAAASTPASVSASASAGTPAAQRTVFRIAGLKGPTTMGMVKLMSDADAGAARHDYAVTMYGAADEIAPLLIKGEVDVVVIPCNLASILYNKTQGAVEVAAINSLGVLYVVSTGDEVKSVADLKGKTIYSTGKGTTPEYVLNYILTENGIDPAKDVTIEYYSEATEVAAAMQNAGDGAIAMLPQPYVTVLGMQMENLTVCLDMTEEWNKVSPDSGLVTGVVVARKEFVEANEAAFNEFLADYTASAAYVNENVEDAANLVAQYEIVAKAPIAQKAIPACNIVSITGSEMKAKIGGYLQVLYDQNPEAVGGTLPDDAFYYGA